MSQTPQFSSEILRDDLCGDDDLDGSDSDDTDEGSEPWQVKL